MSSINTGIYVIEDVVNKDKEIKDFFDNMYSATQDLFKRLRNSKSIDLFVNRLIEMEMCKETSSINRIFQKHYKQLQLSSNLLHFYKFTYNAMEQKTKFLRKYGSDILCGLYFPNNSIGDEIAISSNNKWLHTIYIKNKSDLEKIHLPIKAEFMLPLICLGLADINISVQNNLQKPYYSIGLTIGDPSLRNDLTQSKFIYKGINLIFQNYCCIYVEPDYDTNNEFILCDYNEIYAANLIKKYWKRYKLKKNKRDKVCGEIRALPGRGIDYKNAMKDFYTNI